MSDGERGHFVGDQLVADGESVEEIARQVAACPSFAIDLEFVSDGRYMPDLALLQVAWGEAPSIALIDCVAVDPAPLLALLASPDHETVVHAANQDLAILMSAFGVSVERLVDTQIAAAFLGIGDQIGYANLVKKLFGTSLEKESQYTEWLRRPLSSSQLRYAANDVRYLGRAWQKLSESLAGKGRLAWVIEESAALARATTPKAPDQGAYAELKGRRGLSPRAMGSLRELAGWRQSTARRRNKPLPWVLPERAMIDLCRSTPRTVGDLKRVRGVGEGTVRRYGREILDCIARGAAAPVAVPESRRLALSARGQVWASVVANLIQARGVAEEIAPRFVATRANAEALVEWFEHGDRECEPPLPLLSGWRRELVGGAALAWLEGGASIAVDSEGPAALRLVEP